jgi:hypothetical protein
VERASGTSEWNEFQFVMERDGLYSQSQQTVSMQESVMSVQCPHATMMIDKLGSNNRKKQINIKKKHYITENAQA